MSALLWGNDVHTDTYVTETPRPAAVHTHTYRSTMMHRYTETHRCIMAIPDHPRVLLMHLTRKYNHAWRRQTPTMGEDVGLGGASRFPPSTLGTRTCMGLGRSGYDPPPRLERLSGGQ